MKISLTNEFAQEEMQANLALMQVMDPELNVNIVDLGLVYGVDFRDPKMVTVTMTLSTPHCPMGDAIEQGVIHVLYDAFPDREAKIELVWEPAWSIDNISEAGREQLGL